MNESEISGKDELDDDVLYTCDLIDKNPIDPIENLNVLLNVIADIALYSLSEEASKSFINTLTRTLNSVSLADADSEGALH
jgi:hypothetical protein|tara:strand:- start:2548 stop:2790 length:243 start_codon:yes stop_codon:yes gene_type:complete